MSLAVTAAIDAALAPRGVDTLAVRAGMTGHAVAAALGHESVTTTYGNYATASAVEGARQKAALMVLSGGRR
jgi:hypothetical protein